MNIAIFAFIQEGGHSMQKHEVELIQSFINGNENAFDEIYKLYYKRVYLTVLSYLNRVGEAEDIAQESFIEMFYSLKNRREPKAFIAWMYHIIHFNCKQKVRKKLSYDN